jgi:hypothetical protein
MANFAFEIPRWAPRLAAVLLFALIAYQIWDGLTTRRNHRAGNNVIFAARQYLADQRQPRIGEPVLWDERPVMCRLTRSPFVWQTSRLEQDVFDMNGPVPQNPQFYACSESANWRGYRCFVFTGPLGTKILHDTQVDWQTRTRRSTR